MAWGCAVVLDKRIFSVSKKDPSEVWPLARFHVSLWTLVSKFFCNYSIGNIILSWKPSL